SRQGMEQDVNKGFVRCVLTLATGALIAAVLPVAGASAAPQHNPHGRHGGYVSAPRAKNGAAITNVSGSPLLSYHSGPVMHQSTAYAIFWNPSGSGLSYPANYKSVLAQYFTDVAAANGRANNPYGVMPQYTDG